MRVLGGFLQLSDAESVTFLSRDRQPHRLNSSFLRLRSGSDSASKYLWDGATPDSSAKNTEWLQLKPNVSPSKESSRAPCGPSLTATQPRLLPQNNIRLEN